MKQTLNAGLSSLQIIIILTVLAVMFALITTITGHSEDQAATDVNETARATDTPIETFAQNEAAELANPVIEAVAQRNMEMEAQMDLDAAPEVDTTSALPTEVAEERMATAAGTFTQYSEDKLALAENGTVVLFFHANWCPSCRGLEDDLNANLSALPENTHILKLDYDTETELKKKYSVIRQHTLIVVNADGTEIKKLTGLTNTLDQVISQL